jgi:hypothetical protein
LCPLAQPLIKAAIPATKNAITPHKAEKLLALIDSPKPAIERKTRIHEITAAISNQPPARSQDEAHPRLLGRTPRALFHAGYVSARSVQLERDRH